MSRDIEEADVTQPLANTATTSSSNNPKPKPKSDPVLATCRCFSFVTVVASILCIIANVYSAVRSFTDGLDIFDGIFRCYAVVIAVFVIVAETEWSFVTKFWKVLEYWAGRGMLQIFVAVMTRAYSDTYTERHAILLLQDIASYTMLACGLIYVVSIYMELIVYTKGPRRQVPATEGMKGRFLQGWRSCLCGPGPYTRLRVGEAAWSRTCRESSALVSSSGLAKTNKFLHSKPLKICRNLSNAEQNLKHC